MTPWRERKQFTEVLGQRMAHVEMGQGQTILFIHGNPTSSFLWRDVMAELDGAGRLIAPDLIGMGDSDKLPDSGPDRYTFAEHARFFDAWMDAVLPEGPITLVLHDWGGALGFHWARRHADRVSGLAYMETIVRPIPWKDWPEAITPLFQAMRSPAGEDMILEKNIFVENILRGSVIREMTEDEMDEYRRPFADPGESRRPTLTWPRQIPLGGEPEDVHQIAQDYFEWLQTSDVPKLFVNAEPGAILVGAIRDGIRNLPNQTEVTVAGTHFIQEDSGAEIGRAIKTWLR